MNPQSTVSTSWICILFLLLPFSSHVLWGASDANIDLNEQMNRMLQNTSLEELAQNFVIHSLAQDPSLLNAAYTRLVNSNSMTTPVGIRITLGMIEKDLINHHYEHIPERLRSVCAQVNSNPEKTRYSRLCLTANIHSYASVEKKVDEPDTITKVELLRIIEDALDVNPKDDWFFYMNIAVNEVSDESNLERAKELLDLVHDYIPKEQQIRWLFNSAALNYKSGLLENALKECELIKRLCKEHPEEYSDYCELYTPMIVDLEKNIEGKRIEKAGIKYVIGEVENLIESSVNQAIAEDSFKGERSPVLENDSKIRSLDRFSGTDNQSSEQESPATAYKFLTPAIYLFSFMTIAATTIALFMMKKQHILIRSAVVLLPLLVWTCYFIFHYKASTSKINNPPRPILQNDLIALGEKEVDTEVEYVIRLYNPTDKNVNVLAVKTSCSCTNITENFESVIMPYSTASVTIKASIKSQLPKMQTFNTLIVLEGYAPLIHQATVDVIPSSGLSP